MARNLILFLSSAGMLALLFAAYVRLTRVPDAVVDRAAAPALPTEKPASDDQIVRIQTPELSAEVAAGQRMEMTIYDDQGRPIAKLQCQTWRRSENENEFHIIEPEFTVLLSGGMVATISARESVATGRRTRLQQLQPQRGWLAGDARIVVDRSTAEDRPPLSERPEDRIEIRAERLDFDAELGTVHTDGVIRAVAADFELSGAGLDLTWNRVENRIDHLSLARGEQLIVRRANLLAAPATEAVPPPPDSQPAVPLAEELAAERRARRPRQAYSCALTGDVRITHERGERTIARAEADEVSLLVDIGGSAGSAADAASPRPARPTASAATQPAEAERLIVRWSGPLELGPVAAVAADAPARRRFEARGRPMKLEMGDRLLRCANLTYHEDAGRLWLRPAPGHPVELNVGARLFARAAGAYFERDADLIKLIGAVSLESRDSPGGASSLAVRCALWASLCLSPEPAETPVDGGVAPASMPSASAAADESRAGEVDLTAGLFRSTNVEAATFVGDVRVDLPEQTILAQRLDTRFDRAAGAAGTLESSLKSALATGQVRLRTGARKDAWAALALPWRRAEALADAAWGAPLPEDDAPQDLRCDALEASFEVASTEAGPGRAYPRDVTAWGDVRLRDRERIVAVSGDRLVAELASGQDLRRATVRGAERRPAMVHARGYTVWGAQIDADNERETLEVAGSSRLTFHATRSLQGRLPRAGDLPTTVTCAERLRIDSRAKGPGDARGSIEFAGDVDARVGAERLQASTLTLYLADAPAAQAQVSPFARFARAARQALSGQASDPAASGAGRSVAGARKEPIRAVARDATVTSEQFEPSDPRPVVSQLITSREMDLDIPARRVQTRGRTLLGMADRRMAQPEAPGRGAFQIPSALMSSGPSQTTIQCDRAMTYVMGPEGPARRDTVLFEGAVIFAHATGRAMTRPEEMLPRSLSVADALSRLKSRFVLLQCERLEGIFHARPGPAAGSVEPRMELAWLNAGQNVQLRDEREDNARRTVDAHQIEFDREKGIVRVLGSDELGIDARVYDENPRAGRFNTPVVGRDITIDLNNETVRTGRVRGRIDGG